MVGRKDSFLPKLFLVKMIHLGHNVSTFPETWHLPAPAAGPWGRVTGACGGLLPRPAAPRCPTARPGLGPGRDPALLKVEPPLGRDQFPQHLPARCAPRHPRQPGLGRGQTYTGGQGGDELPSSGTRAPRGSVFWRRVPSRQTRSLGRCHPSTGLAPALRWAAATLGAPPREEGENAGNKAGRRWAGTRPARPQGRPPPEPRRRPGAGLGLARRRPLPWRQPEARAARGPHGRCRLGAAPRERGPAGTPGVARAELEKLLRSLGSPRARAGASCDRGHGAPRPARSARAGRSCRTSPRPLRPPPSPPRRPARPTPPFFHTEPPSSPTPARASPQTHAPCVSCGTSPLTKTTNSASPE